MAHEHDMAVIGGGLVGTAIAYGLARLGRRVCLYDEGDIAYRASRGNFGLVWVQGKGQGLVPYGSWTQRSVRQFPEFAAQLRDDTGIDVALEQPGGFHICLSEAELNHRVEQLTRLVAQPGFESYPFDVLDRAALMRRLPGLGPQVAGATYCRLDGHLNPLRLLRALHAGFLQRGGTYHANAKVETITREGNAFALRTAAGATEAGQVVLAAGLGNATLAPQVGLAAMVRPQRGMVVVLERVRRFLLYPLSTLRQTDEGTVLIGDSQEEVGFDDSLDTAVLATLATRAAQVFPFLRDARVNRTWAALRVMSPDGFPIYEQSASAPGAFVVTCHSGVTLAAAHAFELAPRIVAGDLGAELSPFSSERLNVQKAA